MSALIDILSYLAGRLNRVNQRHCAAKPSRARQRRPNHQAPDADENDFTSSIFSLRGDLLLHYCNTSYATTTQELQKTRVTLVFLVRADQTPQINNADTQSAGGEYESDPIAWTGSASHCIRISGTGHLEPRSGLRTSWVHDDHQSSAADALAIAAPRRGGRWNFLQGR